MMLSSILLSTNSNADREAKSLLAKFHDKASHEIQSQEFMTFSRNALEKGKHYHRLYAVMCWIVFSSLVKSHAMQTEIQHHGGQPKFDTFYRMLYRDLLHTLTGVKPNGEAFDTIIGHRQLMLRKISVFVSRMKSVYAML
jgi:hypothetical protein